MNIQKAFILLVVSICWANIASAQREALPPNVTKLLKDNPYVSPKEYILGGVKFEGLTHYSSSILLDITKLDVGEKIYIPSDLTSNAIKYLWQQNLFQKIELKKERIVKDTIYLKFIVEEIPRLGAIKIEGVRKGREGGIKEVLENLNGKILNSNLKKTVKQKLDKYFKEKGYYFADFKLENIKGEVPSEENLNIYIDKNNKTRIQKLTIHGNSVFSTKKLSKWIKIRDLSKFRFLLPGRFKEDKLEENKKKLIAKIQGLGYHDVHITKQEIKRAEGSSNINVDIYLHEGQKYYFGDIEWSGNAKYSDEILSRILEIKKGDIFSKERLDKKLSGSQRHDDVSSLYTNDGYLTFSLRPEIKDIRKDTIDLDIKVYEGFQYTNSKIVLRGNERTNDYVILREIRTLPGQKFSKDLLVRSHRELSQLGFIDEKTIDIQPRPNPANGTVDIHYNITEKSADQVEMSASFAADRVIGSVGLSFNNFSIKNIFKLKEYKPLPFGDGQKFSIRVQANGSFYQSYSMNFTNPWMGGKKPINFSTSIYLSSYLGTREVGGGVSIGRRLKWPDDYFQISHGFNIQNVSYDVTRYNFAVANSFNINLSQVITRNSLNGLIFPTGGSNLVISLKATPPYSLLTGKRYANLSERERYRLAEFYKIKLDYQWFQPFIGKFVIKAQAQFGLLGFYNPEIGYPILERFKLGGDGLQGFDVSLRNLELVTLRGYEQGAILPNVDNNNVYNELGSPIYSRYVLELRHPLTLSEGASVYLTSFLEAGNTWANFASFSPFTVKRSVGIGARIFLPIFGLVGIDYAYALDEIPGYPEAHKKRFNFSIVQQLGSGFN